MKLILTAGDLYREIKDRGLELRRGEGRDDALYSELTRNLNMPSMFEHLQDFLDTSQISIETFVELFLTLIEPFAKMYQDIYSCMQRFDARKANQSIRIVFDFEKCKLDFDLRNFKEEIRILQRAKGLKRYKLWNENALKLLFEYIRMLSENVQIHDQYFGNTNYEIGKPYQVPLVPKVSIELHEQLSSIRKDFSSMIDELVEFEKTTKVKDLSNDKIAVFRETNDDQKQKDFENESEAKNIQRLGILLTDLIPRFRELLSKMNSPNYEKLVGSERVQNALEYFDKKITPQLQHSIRSMETKIEILLEILNLPMWKHRWFLYEVWCSLQAVEAVDSYDSCLSLKDGWLNIGEGNRWSELAEFKSNRGIGTFFCQAYMWRLIKS
jgi:hypothetical protein